MSQISSNYINCCVREKKHTNIHGRKEITQKHLKCPRFSEREY
jgi:hypothetical protein